MTLKDVLDEIKRGLKEPETNGHWSNSALIRRCNIGQRKVVRRTSCMEARWEASTVIDQRSYSKPLLCLSVLRAYYEYAGKRLYPVTTSDLDLYASTGKITSPWTDTKGTPTHYYETFRNVWLYPVPDSVATFGIEGILRPDELAVDADIPFNNEPYMVDYHDLLVSFVLWRCFLEDDNKQYEVHEKDFNEGIGSILMDMKRKPDTLGSFDLIRPQRGVKRGPLPGV